LQVSAPAEGLRAELLALDGVRAVQVESAATDQRALDVACEVTAGSGAEAMIARAVARRWDLLRLERRQPTLENVFLHYVRATPGMPQAA
jgi:hypothetical protein